MNTWKTVFIVFWICLVLSVISGMAYLSPIEVEDKRKPQKNAGLYKSEIRNPKSEIARDMGADGVDWVERSETQQSNLSPTSIVDPKLVPNLDWGSKLDKAEFAQKTQKLQMPFIANNGQVDEQVRFYAKTFGGTVFVTKDGDIVYALPKSGDVEDWETHRKAAKCTKERSEKHISHKDTKNTEEINKDKTGYTGLTGYRGKEGQCIVHRTLCTQAGSGLQPEPLNLLNTGVCAIDTFSKCINTGVQVANLIPQGGCGPRVTENGMRRMADGWHGQAPLVRADLVTHNSTKATGDVAGYCPPLAGVQGVERNKWKAWQVYNSNVLPANYHAKSPLLGGDLGVGEPLPETYPQLRLGTQNLSPTSIGDPKSKIQNPKSEARGVALKEQLVGGKIGEIKGGAQSVTTVSYFKGNDPSKWKSNI